MREYNFKPILLVRRYEEPMNKYLYITDLLDRNERLFYKLLSENIEELMPIVYTPTVGLACQKYGYAFKKPQVRISIESYYPSTICFIIIG